MKTIQERKAPVYRDVISILKIHDLETGEDEIVRSFDYLIEAPNWLPDGSGLVYNSLGRLVRLPFGGEPEVIDTGCCDECNNDHAVSFDGKQIALSHFTWEDGQSRVYTVDAAGGVPVLVTPLAPSYLHGWAPDGKMLVYCAERDGEYDIYAIPAWGGKEERLTSAPGLNDGAEYAPDGKHIWFNSVRSGLMQIWRMNADGSDQRRMTENRRNNWFPHVSPDGNKVVYISYREGDVEPGKHPANKEVEIHLMNADGSDDHTIIELFGGQGSLNVNSWSPDSKRFAYVSYQLKA